jgi:hypothetical protein
MTTFPTDKFGGNKVDNNLSYCFKNTLIKCDHDDLGFKGFAYTWDNNQPNSNLISSRLYR